MAQLIQALLAGDAAGGLNVLAQLDDRGRDAAVVLEQVIEQIRNEIAASLAPGGDPQSGAALAALARRLATIDPERRGVGGTRFQLELALLDAATRSGAAVMAVPEATTRSTDVPAARPATPQPNPAPATAQASSEPRTGETGSRMSKARMPPVKKAMVVNLP